MADGGTAPGAVSRPRDRWRACAHVMRAAKSRFPAQHLCRRTLEFVHRSQIATPDATLSTLLLAAAAVPSLPKGDALARQHNSEFDAAVVRHSPPGVAAAGKTSDAGSGGGGAGGAAAPDSATPAGGGSRLAGAHAPRTGAFCFFGLSKCFERICLPSIKRHLLGLYPHFDIYVHTYDLEVTSNPRNNEVDGRLDVGSVHHLAALGACKDGSNLEITSQDVFDAEGMGGYAFLEGKHDHYKNGFASMKNQLRCSNSIRRAFMLAARSGRKYDAIVISRLDVMYCTDLRIPTPLRPNCAYLPPNGGVNDRFFFGTFNSAALYSQRLESFVSQLTQGKRCNTEALLRNYLLKQRKMQVEPIPLKFLRIRSDGSTPRMDAQMVNRHIKTRVRVGGRTEKNIAVDQIDFGPAGNPVLPLPLPRGDR